MNLKRIAAGLIAGAVICGSTGVYPYAAMNYAAAAETADKAETEEKEEALTAESFIAGGYDANYATIYSDGSKTFNMNGRTYSNGVVFSGQYSYQASTATISYNTKNIKNVSWVWGHIDGADMTGATVSIYLDDVLTDKYPLSADMLWQDYTVDVSETSILKVAVTFNEDSKYAMAQVEIDNIKPILKPVVPEYESVDSFIGGRYNYQNYSTFSAVSDLEATRVNGRYYYRGLVFSGAYSYQSSNSRVCFNTENVNSISCSWGHMDNTSMTGATVSVYYDNVLTDKFSLSPTMPITDYTFDLKDVSELKIVVTNNEDAKYVMTDITVDANKTAKTGKAPTYKTPEMFISDGYNRVNTSYFSAVSDLEAKRVNGRYYYQGLIFSGAYSYASSNSIIDFNVENIDSISGTLGHVDNTAMTNAVLSVYKDGVLTEKVELSCHILPQKITVDTKDCKNLRLSVAHEENAKFVLADISMNDTEAKKTHTVPDYKDSKAFVTSAFDAYNTSSFNLVSELDAYTINGEKCYNGILFSGVYSYASSTSSVNFNTENINSISWTWGHVDNSPLTNAKASIYIDRVLVEEIELTSGMTPQKQVLDVSDASRLRIIVKHDENAKYVLKDIEISDEIIEVKVPLGDVNFDGAVNSVDASLVLAEYAAISTNGTLKFDEKANKAADVNKDEVIDSSDASLVLAYYAYTSTGGTETDMEKWIESEK